MHVQVTPDEALTTTGGNATLEALRQVGDAARGAGAGLENAAPVRLGRAVVQPVVQPVLRPVLIVEQDVPLGRFLRRELASASFAVDVVQDGGAALEKILATRYDLLLLDLDLPLPAGIGLIEQVRRMQPWLPLVVLTARSEALLSALAKGADDFMTKPFSCAELIARMGSLLRRTGEVARARRPPLSAVGVTVDREEYKVERNGRPVALTPREFAILECLVRHAGSPVSRSTLMAEVWKAPFNPASNIVDVYMKYLRDKLDVHGEAKLIRTVRGVGYAIAGQ